MKWVVLPFSESDSEETKSIKVKIYPFSCNKEYYYTNSIRKSVRINHNISVFYLPTFLPNLRLMRPLPIVFTPTE